MVFCVVVAPPLFSADPELGGRERLAALRAQFEELKPDVTAAQRRLDERYLGEMIALEKKAQDAGNLDLVVAAKKEAEEFKNRKGPAPESKFAELGRLRKVYADESARILREEMEGVTTLVKGYRTKLLELQRELTQAGEIDAALKVQEEVKRLDREEPLAVAEATAPDPALPDTIRGARPGLVVKEYRRLESQKGDGGFVGYQRLKTEPEEATKTIASLSGWNYAAGRNAIATGYLKIEEAGDYQFNSISFYDRNALYVRDEDSPLCRYRDGEGKVQTISLPAGMVRIISVGYVDARGNCRVRWKPPGQEGLSPIPDDLLFHTEDDK